MTLKALTCVLLTLMSCATAEERRVASKDLSPFQEELVAWYEAGKQALATGQEPPARSEREEAWRAWHTAWGEETHRALQEGLRQPEKIHDLVVARTGEQERKFIDACVGHDYELVEILAYVDFEKANLLHDIYSATETFIRSP